MKPKPRRPPPKPLPTKPLPSKRLPSKPLPSKPAPSTYAANQQQNNNSNVSNFHHVPPSKPQPDPPQQPDPPPDPQLDNTPDPQPAAPSNLQPDPQPQPQVQSDPQPQSNPDPPSNNWYKPQTISKNSYKSQKAKTCKLLLEDKKNNTKKCKLFQSYDKFFKAESNSKNRGFIVSEICKNEFGNAFKKMGIVAGWKIIKIDNKALPKKSFPMLKNKIKSIGDKCGNKGYYVVFDGNMKEDDDADADADDQKLPQLNAAPVSFGKASVELIKSFNDHKVIRIKHSLDKYIECGSVKGPKGYKITNFKPKFGHELQQYGIDIDWRLIKLGNKDTSKMMFMVIKTNLDVEWRNHVTGMEITFGHPL